MRSEKGQFVKGHTETEEEKIFRMAAVARAFDDRSKEFGGKYSGTKFHNSWRAVRFTLKGKKAGCSTDWLQFENFYRDMHASYSEGHLLARRDKNLPFSKENCFWVEKSLHRLTRSLIKLSYNGEELTLKEWSIKLDIPLAGLQQRYHMGKGYSVEEILFGKKKAKRVINAEDEINTRSSKLVAQYRVKDAKRGHENDLDRPWFIENILLKPCTYCGGYERIGADRKDNSIGHIKNNLLPCCYSCNTIRGDRFSIEEMLLIGEVLKKINLKRYEKTG